MTVFLCSTCGTSFPDAPAAPQRCPICEDERQYVPALGQSWTTREALAATHRNAWRQHEPGLFSLQSVPSFAIDQRAFLIRTPAGNVLWDCVALFDAATESLVRALGGLTAIAISHLHEADRDWVMRPSRLLRFWAGETLDLLPAMTLVRAGGHFPGGTVLHWAGTADGAGALLAGDIVQVTPGARRVSFMWSYPNMLPLSADAVRQVTARLEPWRYQRIYGAFAGQEVLHDGPGIIARSAARYVELLEDAAGTS